MNFLSNSKAFYAYIGLTFFISGLFINMIQAILYLTLYRANINLYRKVNYYLTYMMWSRKFLFVIFSKFNFVLFILYRNCCSDRLVVENEADRLFCR